MKAKGKHTTAPGDIQHARRRMIADSIRDVRKIQTRTEVQVKRKDMQGHRRSLIHGILMFQVKPNEEDQRQPKHFLRRQQYKIHPQEGKIARNSQISESHCSFHHSETEQSISSRHETRKARSLICFQEEQKS
jgi:hypothetical protein